MNNKLNLKGVTPSMVTSFVLSFVALGNIIFTAFGLNPISLDNGQMYDIVSVIFVIGTTLHGMYKNFNVTDGSQKLQTVLDMVNNGQILMEDVDKMISQLQADGALKKAVEDANVK